MRGVTRAVLAVLLVATVGGVASAHPGLATKGRGIALVPIDDFPPVTTQTLAALIRSRYGVQVVVTAPVAHPAAAYVASRHQLRAEDVVAAVIRKTNTRLPRGVSTGIALTTRDIYAPSAGEAWAFAYQSPTKLLYLISTARLDPSFFGLHPDREIEQSRLDKLLARAVGTLSLAKSYSTNPRSPLTSHLLSMDDLDLMTESFTPSASAAERRWLARAGDICSAGARAVSRASLGRPSSRPEALSRLAKVIELEQQWFPRLERQVAAPEDRVRVGKLRSTLGRLLAVDKAALASLESTWSDAGYRRYLIDDGSAGNRAIWLTLDLGSKSCGRFVEAI